MAARLEAHGVQTSVEDAYRYAAAIFARVVSDGYIAMVRTVPWLYGYIYDRAERAHAAGGFRVHAAEFAARRLRPTLLRDRPDAVVCTHAFACNVMSAYKRLFDPSLPVLGIVTDFVVHPFWVYDNVDAYAVATPEIKEALVARGVPAARIAVDGIPVDPRFGTPPVDPAPLRARLGLPQHGAIALIMGGGLGLGPVERAVEALEGTGVEPVVLAGRNRALAERLAARGTRVAGFVDNVYDWMHAADVLVTKPGGLTTSEALAAGIPMVLLKPLPGQEERNEHYLLAHGAVMTARGSREVAAAVGHIAGRDPSVFALRAAAASLARPHAADRVAERVLSFIIERRPLPART